MFTLKAYKQVFSSEEAIACRQTVEGLKEKLHELGKQCRRLVCLSDR